MAMACLENVAIYGRFGASAEVLGLELALERLVSRAGRGSAY
jgi:hypothetical protein